MQSIFVTYKIEIVAAIVSLIVTIVTTFLTHFLNYPKLVFAEKAKIVGELSKKKYEGILKIREAIEPLSLYEDLCVTEPEDSIILPLKGKTMQTPFVCYDYKRLTETACDLNDLHKEYGHCLQSIPVMYLIFIRNFLFDYAKLCHNLGIDDEEMRWVSVPIYSGIHIWYKNFHKALVKSMNRPSTKYYSHSGLIYNIILKVYKYKYIHSKMYKCVYGKKSFFKEFIAYKEQMREEDEQYIIENSEQINMEDESGAN